jgi:hypothetical protein
MLENVVTGILAIAGVVVGALVTHFLNRELRSVEVALKHAELEKMQSLKNAELEKMQLELEKMQLEREVLRHQLSKVLKEEEFWQQVDQQTSINMEKKEVPRWRAMKESFVKAVDPQLFTIIDDATPVDDAARVRKDANRCLDSFFEEFSGQILPNRELIAALASIDAYTDMLDRRRYRLLESAEFPTSERLYREKREFDKLMDNFRSLKQSVVRASVSPGMTLRGASFEKLDLEGVDFSGTKLQNSSFREAQLRSSNFEDAEMEYCDLTLAKLEGSNLSKAKLNRANLVLADLRDANLGETDLRDADLSQANMIGADVSGAKFLGAKYSKGREYKHDTKWPDGFDPKMAGAVTGDKDE